jgi:hypothetical protein
MKKWLTSSVIVVYLTALSWGIVSHAVEYKNGSHPVMYFLVWDMFCGWTGYAGRIQIVGEGESGKYYELAPGPWGAFTPFGNIGRRHYDVTGVRGAKLAHNTLNHTRHEPMTRIFVIEESWAKKYNLPDHLWNERFDEPKKLYRYYHVMHSFSIDGALLESNGTWLNRQYVLSVTSNPRLAQDSRKGKPIYAYRNRPRGTYRPGTIFDYSASGQEGSRLGGN